MRSAAQHALRKSLMFISCIWGIAASMPAQATGSDAASLAVIQSAIPFAKDGNLPCDASNSAAPHRCIRVVVKEDRGNAHSRNVELHVHVWPARNPTTPRRALFVIAGGPGDRPAASLNEFSEPFILEREDHDLVVIDPRGSDDSPDLRCWSGSRVADGTGAEASLWPADQITRCLSALAGVADPNHFTTNDAADDVHDVWQALAYGPIDVVAYSYGTRLAQVLMKRHPRIVRSATLIGPLPLGAHIPEDIARHAERAAVAMLDACLDMPECHRNHPHLLADWSTVKARLASGDFTLADPAKEQRRRIPPGIVASWMRSRLYNASTAVSLPSLVTKLAHGDDQQILTAVEAWRRGFERAGAWGLYFSVTCAEDIPFINWEIASAEAADSFIGGYRLNIQRDGCRQWPVRPVDPSFHEPLVTDIPVLVMVGEMDPVTPPAYGMRLVQSLSRARLLRVPLRGHGVNEDWHSCLGPLTHAFITTASADQLDTQCVGQLVLPAFSR